MPVIFSSWVYGLLQGRQFNQPVGRIHFEIPPRLYIWLWQTRLPFCCCDPRWKLWMHPDPRLSDNTGRLRDDVCVWWAARNLWWRQRSIYLRHQHRYLQTLPGKLPYSKIEQGRGISKVCLQGTLWYSYVGHISAYYVAALNIVSCNDLNQCILQVFIWNNDDPSFLLWTVTTREISVLILALRWNVC